MTCSAREAGDHATIASVLTEDRNRNRRRMMLHLHPESGMPILPNLPSTPC